MVVFTIERQVQCTRHATCTLQPEKKLLFFVNGQRGRMVLQASVSVLKQVQAEINGRVSSQFLRDLERSADVKHPL